MAIVNKFGGNVQVAGNTVSLSFVATPAAGVTFPQQVVTPLALEQGGAQNIVVTAYANDQKIVLPTASQANEGESYTFFVPTGGTHNVLICYPTAATTVVDLTENNAFATYVCTNQYTTSGGNAWGWVLTSYSPGA